MKITSGYKNQKYRSVFGFAHFGHDAISLDGIKTIYGSGCGTVIAAGYDSICGNVVVVKYRNCYNEKTSKVQDVMVRYFHLASILVKVGESVTKDTRLGIMGRSGKYASGVHLHYEIDTDAREQYALWTPTVGSRGTILIPGTDSTVNPSYFIHTKTTSPDNQAITMVTDGYALQEDVATVKIK